MPFAGHGAALPLLDKRRAEVYNKTVPICAVQNGSVLREAGCKSPTAATTVMADGSAYATDDPGRRALRLMPESGDRPHSGDRALWQGSARCNVFTSLWRRFFYP